MKMDTDFEVSDEARINAAVESQGEMCEYTKMDVESVKTAIEDWVRAIDVILMAAEGYNIARRNFGEQIVKVSLCQGREMTIGLEAYRKTGDSTLLDRRRQGLVAIETMRKVLHEKLEQVRKIEFLG
jgi:hypothetical protein